jgi:alpha-1,2-mannosyltransferase
VVAVFVATVLIGFAVKPTDAWHFWTSYIWQPDRIYPQAGNIYNQSLRAILARLVHSNSPTAAWLPAAIVVLAVGLAVAIMLHRRGLELEAVIAIAFTAELISPVSWVYHWVWFVPLVVCVGVRAALSPTIRGKLGWGVVTLAVAAVPAFHPYTYPSWMLPPTSTTGQLEADSLALAGLLLLALGALLPRSAKSEEASVRSDHDGLPAPQGG